MLGKVGWLSRRNIELGIKVSSGHHCQFELLRFILANATPVPLGSPLNRMATCPSSFKKGPVSI